MSERGFIVAGARILKRAWQIYVAHVFLFVIYHGARSPMWRRASRIRSMRKKWAPSIFSSSRTSRIVQALLLKFKPVNMDVLPLYIVLLLLFPPILWLLLRKPTLALSASVALYAASWEFGWNLPAYPSGTWFFNPFAWQLLFVFGAWCALGGAERLSAGLRSRITLGSRDRLSGVCVSDHDDLALPAAGTVRAEVARATRCILSTRPISTSCALRISWRSAAVTVLLHPARLAGAAIGLIFSPAILCGQHSLEIFCLGVFLAFAAHFVRSKSPAACRCRSWSACSAS